MKIKNGAFIGLCALVMLGEIAIARESGKGIRVEVEAKASSAERLAARIWRAILSASIRRFRQTHPADGESADPRGL